MDEAESPSDDGTSSHKVKSVQPEKDEGTKRARIRNKIIKEIMDSEMTYQRHLELVIQYFEGPLRDLNLVPDHVIVTIFSNVRQIVSVNQELVEHLSQTSVGQAFLRMGPFFKLYSTYANNHERALAAMIEWEQKRPEFGAWRRHQEELPEMTGLKLNSLLITPVQRIPRYKLLLEDLLSNTDMSNEDYSAIEEAVSQISAVASHINEHIRQHDNFNKMLAIQKSLAGPGAPRILTPGRVFIKDGPLKKVAKKGGRSHERMFFLFSDILLYAKPKFVDQVLSGSYVCCCVLPLHHCSVDTVFGHSQSSGSLFTITCKNESLLLYSDQKSVQSWVAVLRKAIQNLQDCRQTLRKPSSALQPLRRPGLVQLRKQQKKKDHLQNAKRTPDRISHSPKSIKRALAEANMNCLSPRKQRKASGPVQNICKALDPVFSENDLEVSAPQLKCPSSETKSSQHLKTPESHTKARQKNKMAEKIKMHIRHLGGKHTEKALEANNRENIHPYHFSPEPKKQGPDCDIEEILDPAQPKWDIFDTALPDTNVVWRSRLDSDPPNVRRPVVPTRQERTLSESDISLQRPRSEISENTSRIWKPRPDSEISDDFENSNHDLDDEAFLPQEYEVHYNALKGSGTELVTCPLKPGILKQRQPRFDSDMEREAELDRTYSHSSRDFLAKYDFDDEGSPKPRIYHKQSESMLMPWKTEWLSPSPPRNKVELDNSCESQNSPPTRPDSIPDGRGALNLYDPAYPLSDYSTDSGLCPIHEESDSSIQNNKQGQFHNDVDHYQDTLPVTPKTKPESNRFRKLIA